MLPEIRAYMAKARLRRGIEMVKLANRIEALKMQEDEEEDVPQAGDVPALHPLLHQLSLPTLTPSSRLPVKSHQLSVPVNATTSSVSRLLFQESSV